MTTIEKPLFPQAISASDYALLERIARRSEVIARASTSLAQAQDEQAILSAIVEATRDHSVGLYTLSYVDDRQQYLTAVALQSMNGQPLPLSTLPTTTIALEAHPLIKLAFKTPNQVTVVENVEQDQRLSPESKQVLRMMGMAAFIGIPLKSGSQTQAALSLNWSAPQHFSPDLLETLIGLIPTAAAVINSRRNIIELQQSEARYHALASNLPKMAVALYDHDLRFLLVEGEEASTVGLPKELIEGKTLGEALPPELVAEYEGRFRAALDGQTVSVETVMNHQHMRLMYLPIKDEQGKVINAIALAVNITEQKRSEEALQESRNLLQIVLDSIPVRVFWKDTNGVYLGCNKLFAADARSSDVVGRDDFELFPIEANLYRADDRYVIDNNVERINFEEPQTLSSGDQIWLRTSKVPLRNFRGEIIGVMGTYDDITERKKTEIALRQSEEQYRAIFEATSDGLIINDLETGAVIDVNPAVLKMHGGYTREEFLKLHQEHFIAPEDMHKFEPFMQALQAGKTSFVEARDKRKDGSIFDIEVTGTQFTYQGKRRILSVLRDISERVAAEAKIAASAKRTRDILDNLSVFAVLMDRDGTMIEVNSPIYAVTALKPEDLIGRPYVEAGWFRHARQAEMQRISAEQIREAAKGRQVTVEVESVIVNDQRLNVQVTIGPIFNEAGEVVNLVASGVDITSLRRAEIEQKRLIAELQAATRLAQENSRLKSEFLSTMSHELRTPLNAIEGFTGIVLTKMGGAEFNDKTERYLTRVHANSRRLLQLINDFLDLSRIESGRLQLANQPFSPTRLARRWQDEIGVLADKKGLNFTVNIPDNMPETLIGDEEAVSKVAINLLGNAIKFTERGSVTLTLHNNSDSWDIVVTDTGIGIPPHARDFIFEEFRQVDQTSKRKYGGTGLGLAIVQKYTRAMGGTVAVVSEQGQGSKFTITLPAKTSN